MSERPGTVRRLLQQSGLYTLGTTLVKASGILLAFIHWNPAYLSVADYGYLDGLQAAALLVIPLLGMGLSSGLIREMSGPHAPSTAFSAFASALSLSVGGGLLLVLAAPRLAPLLGDLPHAATAIRLIAGYAAAKSVVLIPMTYLQAREKAGLYSLALLGEFTFLILGNVVFVVALGMGLHGALWALFLSATGSAVLLSAGMLRQVTWHAERAVIAKLLRFGAPLVLAALAFPFLHVGDRFLIGWLGSAADLGVYGAAARVAGVVNMVLVQGFQSAFLVIGLKTLSAGEGAALHRRVFRHFTIAGCGFVLGLSLFAYDTLRLIARDPAYLDAALLIFPLAFGFFAYGLYAITVNTLYAHGYTRQVAMGVVGAALLNALLNVALLPVMGILGAALATLLAYAVLALSAAFVSQRLERFRFPWRVLISVAAVATLLWALALPTQDWGTLPRLGARAMLMLLYPLLVLAVRGYTLSEVRMLLDAFREWWKKRSKQKPSESDVLPEG